MNHTLSIVETRQLSDGEFALAVICCNDPQTKSFLTMAASVASDPVKCQDSVNYHCNRVANLHDLALQSRTALANLLGTSATVSLPDPAAPSDPAPVQPAPTTPADPSTPSDPGTSPQ